jgi:spore maturation protein CgeB
MKPPSLNFVFLGLSITSSWGNGHATTYRGLVRGLSARGHKVLFLERDQEWYAANRDLVQPPYGRTELYQSLTELKKCFSPEVREADVVVVGSYVPQGTAVGEWVTSTARGLTAFYDIDTPVTVAQLEKGDAPYISRKLIPKYQLYLSFTGGPLLRRMETDFGSPSARPLYCSVDPTIYYPEQRTPRWDLGYLGTYSLDRQPTLDELLLRPAKAWPAGRLVVAGPQYPASIRWPANVERIVHLSPAEHRRFYSEQRFTLNVTRREMVKAGYSPSVRLFEAAACGTPIISDAWDGLETLFEPGKEILIAHSSKEALSFLRELSEAERSRLAEGARRRVLNGHTAAHRAAELEGYVMEHHGGQLACH